MSRGPAVFERSDTGALDLSSEKLVRKSASPISYPLPGVKRLLFFFFCFFLLLLFPQGNQCVPRGKDPWLQAYSGVSRLEDTGLDKKAQGSAILSTP